MALNQLKGGGGGTPPKPPKKTIKVDQPGHGFSDILKGIYYDAPASKWKLSDKDHKSTAVITEITDANTFYYAVKGVVPADAAGAGKLPGQDYILNRDTGTNATDTLPTNAKTYTKLFKVLSGAEVQITLEDVEAEQKVSAQNTHSEPITQNAHGFKVTDPVYWNGTKWVLSSDKTQDTADAIVVEVTDANTIVVGYSGLFDIGTHGKFVREYYWLGDKASIRDDDPDTTKQQVFKVISATEILINIGDPFAPGKKENKEEVTQTSHGFKVTDPVYWNGTQWVLASDKLEMSADAVVVTVTNADKFTLGYAGKYEVGGHGKLAGEYYWLGDKTAIRNNDVTTTEQQLFKVISATEIVVNIGDAFAPGTKVDPTKDIPHTSVTVTKPSHGFNTTSIGLPVWYDANTLSWKPASTVTDDTADAIIVEVTDANTFIVCYQGEYEAVGHGKVVGEYYWLGVGQAVKDIDYDKVIQGLYKVISTSKLLIKISDSIKKV